MQPPDHHGQQCRPEPAGQEHAADRHRLLPSQRLVGGDDKDDREDIADHRGARSPEPREAEAEKAQEGHGQHHGEPGIPQQAEAGPDGGAKHGEGQQRRNAEADRATDIAEAGEECGHGHVEQRRPAQPLMGQDHQGEGCGGADAFHRLQGAQVPSPGNAGEVCAGIAGCAGPAARKAEGGLSGGHGFHRGARASAWQSGFLPAWESFRGLSVGEARAPFAGVFLLASLLPDNLHNLATPAPLPRCKFGCPREGLASATFSRTAPDAAAAGS